jgi:hypothetical protein
VPDIEIDGIPQLRSYLDGMIERSRNLEPALLRAGVIALDSDKKRIEEGGPGWPPNKTGTPLLRRTGHLFNSLTAGAADDVLAVNGDTVEAGTNTYYARYLQDGTRGRIRRRREDRLSAMLGGSGFLKHSGAERSGGLPPRPFVLIDEKVAQAVRKVFADHVFGGSDGATQ